MKYYRNEALTTAHFHLSATYFTRSLPKLEYHHERTLRFFRSFKAKKRKLTTVSAVWSVKCIKTKKVIFFALCFFLLDTIVSDRSYVSVFEKEKSGNTYKILFILASSTRKKAPLNAINSYSIIKSFTQQITRLKESIPTCGWIARLEYLENLSPDT